MGRVGGVKIREVMQKPRWMMGGKREKYERGVRGGGSTQRQIQIKPYVGWIQMMKPGAR